MFGYVKVKKSELRMREYDYYLASYCGLCRRMGKCTGQCSRLFLNYDFAFLCNFRMALSGTKPIFRARRCLVHPLHKRPMMEENGELDYAARAAALLNYEKCLDDLRDSKGLKKCRARLLCIFTRRAYRRALRLYPALAKTIREKLRELSDLEKRKLPSADEPAALFGKLLAAVFCEGLSGSDARIAAEVGEKTGRFIYLADAVDDMKKDKKSGNYNPLLLLYGGLPDEEEKKDLEAALLAGIADISVAADLATGNNAECDAVIKNILMLGMPATVKSVLWKECRKEEQVE